MNKNNFQLLKIDYWLFALCTILITSVFGLSSCSKDDDDDGSSPRTKINGRPSRYEFTQNDEGKQTFFFYNEDKLTKVRIKDSEDIYTYTNGYLTKIETRNTNKDIADGNGFTTFTRKKNLIYIETMAEPSWTEYIKEIELNSENLPIKITSYTPKVNENPSISYTIYTYDSAKRVTKMEFYNANEKKPETTVTLEYDNSPGSVSKNGLPMWYNIYRADYGYSYANYINNVSKRTIVYNKSGEATTVMNYTYEYNKEGYPVSITQQVAGKEDSHKYTIAY